MFTMLNEELSNELKVILKKGDFESFEKIYKTNKIDPSGHLFAKRKSNEVPLLQKVLGDSFTNSNYTGRLKIANLLIKNGADINDTAPYGFSPLTSFLNQHYYLRTTKAKYDVYLHTLVFALEMVRQDSIDVNLMEKETSGILDAAVEVAEYHIRAGNQELEKIALVIVKELLEKGAKPENPEQEFDEKIQELVNNTKPIMK